VISDKELILHIGAPKTGTSALQKHLFDSAAFFSEYGINYFNSLCVSNDVPNHINIFSDFGTGVHRIISMLEKVHTVKNIFSTELLLFLAQDSGFQIGFQNLIQYCKSKQILVKVVGVIRDPVDYLLSAYAEDVCGGRCPHTFMAWLKSVQGKGHADVPLYMLEWENLVGRNNVHWVYYENEKKNPDFLSKVFRICCGMELPNPRKQLPATFSRRSVKGNLIEAMRRLNEKKYPQWQNFSVAENAYEFLFSMSQCTDFESTPNETSLVLHPSFDFQEFLLAVECYLSAMEALKIDGREGKARKSKMLARTSDGLERIKYDELIVQRYVDLWSGKI